MTVVNLSCESNFNDSEKRGAVIFTFDDAWISEWNSAIPLLDKYGIKATFFINRPHLLTEEQKIILHKLQNKGHEIACHGYNHKNVVEYVDSTDILLAKEILPAKELLTQYGFNIKAYAYPFGSSTPAIDSLLLHYFKYLRKATYNINDTTLDAYDEIYVKSKTQRVFNAMGIDYNYNITSKSFEKGIIRAHKNNEVLVLYAHRIDNEPANYRISEANLEEFFSIVKKHKIHSIRISDLQNYF